MERQSGSTTRRADAYVQELFIKGKIHITDDVVPNTLLQNDLDRRLMHIIAERLKNEHSNNQFELNYGLKTIKLIKQ